MTAQPKEMIIFSLQVQHHFCATSWVESKGVVERAKSLWEHMAKIVNFWKKLPKLKQTKFDSYDILKDASMTHCSKIRFFLFMLLVC